MPKMKTKRGTAKRFKKTGSGKLRRHRANHSHLLTGKSRKRKRRLRTASVISKVDEKLLKRCLPYL